MSDKTVTDALNEIHNLKAFVDALITLACSSNDDLPLTTTNLYSLLKPIEKHITHIINCLNDGGLQ